MMYLVVAWMKQNKKERERERENEKVSERYNVKFTLHVIIFYENPMMENNQNYFQLLSLTSQCQIVHEKYLHFHNSCIAPMFTFQLQLAGL